MCSTHPHHPTPHNLPFVTGWVFDLDGTLIDSWDDIIFSVNKVRRSLSLPERSYEEIGRFIGWGVHYLLQNSIPERAQELEQLNKRFKEIYQEHLLDRTVLYPGAQKLLQLLSSQKHKIALLTNKPSQFSRTILQGLSILGLFHKLIGGDTLNARKPDPAGLATLAQEWQLAPEQMIMVGDSTIDTDTANNFGCQALYVAHREPPPEQLCRHVLCLERLEQILGYIER